MPDRTDRRRRRTRTAGVPAPAAAAGEPGGTAGSDQLLTIEEVIAELRVSRTTFYRWRRQGTGPPAVRLPGGGVRIRRSALRQWLHRLDNPAGGTGPMNSYDVRFWDPRKIGDTARGRWRVRWSVAGREHCRSFPARPLADGSWPASKTPSATASRSTRPPGCPPPAQQAAAGDCQLV